MVFSLSSQIFLMKRDRFLPEIQAVRNQSFILHLPSLIIPLFLSRLSSNSFSAPNFLRVSLCFFCSWLFAAIEDNFGGSFSLFWIKTIFDKKKLSAHSMQCQMFLSPYITFLYPVWRAKNYEYAVKVKLYADFERSRKIKILKIFLV